MKPDKLANATRLRDQIMGVVRRLRCETQAGFLPLTQLALLGTIDRLAGQATPSALAEAERLHSSNLAAQLRLLEGQDLLLRTADTEDGRKIRIHLTRHGRTVLNQNRKQRDKWLAQTIDACLNRQEQQLLAQAGLLLERIARFDPPLA